MLWFFILSLSTVWAQELEVSTDDVQAYARIKNCIDFYLCHPYEESLKINSGRYTWTAKFNEPLSSIQKAFEDCSIDDLKAEIIARNEQGIIQKDFKVPNTPIPYLTKRHLLPMELNPDAYIGLRKKESIMDKLINQRVLDLAMKSTSFEFEYGLGEYVLRSASLPPNVLGQTHHLFKTITYDPDKYDGKICRFYQVMRHEVQHVRNWREKDSCKNKSKTHHFKKNNHNEISTYLNDLVFLKNYCPYEQEIYNNTQAMLLAMYENKKFQPCSSGSSAGSGTGSSDGEAADSESTGSEKETSSKTALSGKGNNHKHSKIGKFQGSSSHDHGANRKIASDQNGQLESESSSTETHYFPQNGVEKFADLSRKIANIRGKYRKMIQDKYGYDESKPYGFRKKEIPDNPNNLQ